MLRDEKQVVSNLSSSVWHFCNYYNTQIAKSIILERNFKLLRHNFNFILTVWKMRNLPITLRKFRVINYQHNTQEFSVKSTLI